MSRNFWSDPVELTQVGLSFMVMGIFAYQIISGQDLNETLKNMALVVLSVYFGKTISANRPNGGAS